MQPLPPRDSGGGTAMWITILVLIFVVGGIVVGGVMCTCLMLVSSASPPDVAAEIRQPATRRS
jgi:hypothetical protein